LKCKKMSSKHMRVEPATLFFQSIIHHRIQSLLPYTSSWIVLTKMNWIEKAYLLQYLSIPMVKYTLYFQILHLSISGSSEKCWKSVSSKFQDSWLPLYTSVRLYFVPESLLCVEG
jgi:hypothetical protein